MLRRPQDFLKKLFAEVLSLLKKLTEAAGVSGYENEVRKIIIDEIKDFCTAMRIDSMGNLIVYKSAKNNSDEAKTILLSAHMDEVGFIITEITDEGYLKFETVGGIEAKILVSKRVKINGLCGVISFKAVHLCTKEEREKKIEENMLYIDIGAKNRKDAEKYVSKGDYCTFDSEYVEFGNMIKAKALDDRLGCAIMAEIIKKDLPVNLFCTFTVQEEVGLRGAKSAIYGINPDYAIVIEGTTCNDMTGVPENLRVTKSGDGVAISILDSASKADEELRNLLIESAKKHNIKYQFKASTSGGNDAGAIHLANGGIKTCSVSVPCRYIHSPISTMHKNDFEACRDIVMAFIEDCAEYGGNENVR